MAKQKIFDSHFHLLFKHFITDGFDVTKNIQLRGLANTFSDVLGGVFESQASPHQLKDSPLYVGVTSLLTVEHAFAVKFLHLLGLDLSGIMPLDKELFDDTKNHKRTYYDELNRQIEFYKKTAKKFAAAPYHIEYLKRADWQNKSLNDIVKELSSGKKRYLAFSIEGGHSLSNVPIRGSEQSQFPELQLQELQERTDIDIMSLNLCHLSYIPEQPLGGFAQGVNKQAQNAFKSPDFTPKEGLGITERGKKVIRQALLHPNRPVLIDVKHMSVYTRFQYYSYREELALEHPKVDKLPIISSHTGFTFTSLSALLKKKEYLAIKNEEENTYAIMCENRKIGRTNDRRNADLYANPWSIGLYDEEIVEIMRTKGIMGISMDQRVIGAVKMFDSSRPKYYEEEYMAEPEWRKLFVEGRFPIAEEGLIERILGMPTRAERHIMLFCTHLVYAAKVGYEALPWMEGTSPWDHLCVGSDLDGLINPLNNFDNVIDMHKMDDALRKYLPIADKYLETDDRNEIKALRYNDNGTVNAEFLEEVISKVLFNNGVHLTARYLRNWED